MLPFLFRIFSCCYSEIIAIFLKPTPFTCHYSHHPLLLLCHCISCFYLNQKLMPCTPTVHFPSNRVNLVFPLYSIHRKEEVLCPPMSAMHINLDQSGTFQKEQRVKKKKRRLQQREVRQRWIMGTKVMSWLWKLPGVPALKSPSPHHMLKLWWIWDLFSRGKSASRIWCRNSPRWWMREDTCLP